MGVLAAGAITLMNCGYPSKDLCSSLVKHYNSIIRAVFDAGESALGTSIPVKKSENQGFPEAPSIPEKSLEVIAAEYQAIRDSINLHQRDLSREYKEADNKKEGEVIQEARAYVLDAMINRIFPSWYGTPWDFNGTAQIPKHGLIACGYFVSTTLEHAGFNVERALLGQQASQYIIKSLVKGKKDVKTVCCNKHMDLFLDTIRGMGDGLFIVGLDCHVGFIINKSGNVTFCHSDYTKRWYGVDREAAAESVALVGSKYKIVGKILDDHMMVAWLTGSRIRTVKKDSLY